MAKPTKAQVKAAIAKLKKMKSVQQFIKLDRAMQKLSGIPPAKPARQSSKKAPVSPKRNPNRGIDRLDDIEEDMARVNASLKKVLAQVKAAGYKGAKISGEGDLDADAEILIKTTKDDAHSIRMQVGKGYFVVHLHDPEGATSWDAKSLSAAINLIKKAEAEAKKQGIKF